MNYSTAVFLINKDVRAVMVSYEPDPNRPNEAKPGGNHLFKTLDPSLKPKDLVLIPTNTRWLMTVGRIEEVDVDVDFDRTDQINWIIGPIDQTGYKDMLSKEQDAISAIRSAEVRQKREALAKALFADNEALKSLPIASAGATLPPPETPPSPGDSAV